VKKIVLFLGLLLSVSLYAEVVMLKATPFADVLQQISKHQMTFIEVGSEAVIVVNAQGNEVYRHVGLLSERKIAKLFIKKWR